MGLARCSGANTQHTAAQKNYQVACQREYSVAPET
jgi:hypothetical protein